MTKPTTIIHFVRHGEVENPQAIRYGRLAGYHLNAAGRKAIEAITPFFKERAISHIYTSPLERTQQTATLIGLALPEVPITLDTRLLETKTAAKFEGKSRDLAFSYPHKPTTDAETKEDIIARLQHFGEAMVLKHHGNEVVAVSHGDPIALYYTHMVYNDTDLAYHSYPTYASIFSFVFEGISLKHAWLNDPNQFTLRDLLGQEE